jgi:hypothetical protein
VGLGIQRGAPKVKSEQFDRLTAAAGLAFVIGAFVERAIVGGEPPAIGSEPGVIASFIAAHRASALTVAAFDGTGVVMFLFFIAGLVRRVEGARSVLGILAITGASLTVLTSYLVDMSLVNAVAFERAGYDPLALTTFVIGVAGADAWFPFPLTIVTGSIAALILGTRAMPAWLGVWSALLAVAYAIVGPVGIVGERSGQVILPVYLAMLLWIVATSVVLIVRPSPHRIESPASAAA